MNRLMLAITFTVMTAALAVAEEKFTIKLKKEVKGDVLQTKVKDSEIGKSSYSVMGKAQSKDDEKITTSAFSEVIVEKETGKRATKLKRTYEKAELSKNGKKISPTFLGSEILIDRSGGAYKFTLNGKELMGDEAAFLKEDFHEKQDDEDSDFERTALPKHAVAINEAWKPDLEAINKSFSKSANAPMTFDVDKSIFVGKLLKAYKSGDRQFGVFEIKILFVVTKIGAGAQEINLDAGSQVAVNMTFDGCIDGSLNASKMDATMELKMVGALKTPEGVEVKIDENLKKTSSKSVAEFSRK